MKIDKATEIVDEKRFVESHTATMQRNQNNKWFDSYRERLEKYKKKTNEANTKTVCNGISALR